MAIYVNSADERIEYEPETAEVAAYLDRVFTAFHDPATSAGALIALVYSGENPIMDHTIVPGKGYVTKDIIDTPVYRVMRDLVWRKEGMRIGF